MISIGIIVIVVTCLISYKGFNDTQLFEKYKFNINSVKNHKEYLRLIGSGFLHADFSHLIFNMISLYFFQGYAIQIFGTFGFIFIYFGSMILGNILTMKIYEKQPWYSAIGASGAVSGIIFAVIAIKPLAIEINFLPGWIFGTLYFGYSVYMMLKPKQWDNLGHAAHIGGAVFGLAFAAVNYPILLSKNIVYIAIMTLPLAFLAYKLLKK